MGAVAQKKIRKPFSLRLANVLYDSDIFKKGQLPKDALIGRAESIIEHAFRQPMEDLRLLRYEIIPTYGNNRPTNNSQKEDFMIYAEVKALLDHIETNKEVMLRGLERDSIVEILIEWLKENHKYVRAEFPKN